MRFEQSIDIDAQQQRVWDVLSDLDAWPQRIETVEAVELLTPPPVGTGTRVRLKQPKLGEGTWEVAAWDVPSTSSSASSLPASPASRAIVSWRWRKVAPA
jgi:uncharacterized membrane protein